MIVDTFMFNDELDLLEARLATMGEAVDMFVAIEARVDHQDHPKPLHLRRALDLTDLFNRWESKLYVLDVTESMPSAEDAPDPWAREHAQRDGAMTFLRDMLDPMDVVLHGDLDEIVDPEVIPSLPAITARQGFVTLQQEGRFWALDWKYPIPWNGTVAGAWKDALALGRLARVRDMRNFAKKISHAGWHFSWLGDDEAARRKVESFCHPEVYDQIDKGLIEGNVFRSKGIHVDGVRLERVPPFEGLPPWFSSGNVPESWTL